MGVEFSLRCVTNTPSAVLMQTCPAQSPAEDMNQTAISLLLMPLHTQVCHVLLPFVQLLH